MEDHDYTKKGDDGPPGRSSAAGRLKDSWRIDLNGVVDEAQAAIGVARAQTPAGTEVNDRLTTLARDLYVLMAEVATAPENRTKLQAGSSLVTPDMVRALEEGIDGLLARFDMPSDFTVPGENRVAAALDLARTIVRRAERIAVAEPTEGSFVVAYLNRLSDLLWAMARWQEGPEHVLSKAPAPRPERCGSGPSPPADAFGGGRGAPVQRRGPVVPAVGMAEEHGAEQAPALGDPEPGAQLRFPLNVPRMHAPSPASTAPSRTVMTPKAASPIQ